MSRENDDDEYSGKNEQITKAIQMALFFFALLFMGFMGGVIGAIVGGPVGLLTGMGIGVLFTSGAAALVILLNYMFERKSPVNVNESHNQIDALVVNHEQQTSHLNGMTVIKDKDSKLSDEIIGPSTLPKGSGLQFFQPTTNSNETRNLVTVQSPMDDLNNEDDGVHNTTQFKHYYKHEIK